MIVNLLNFENSSQNKLLENHLKNLKHLVPNWVRTLTVKFYTSDNSSIIAETSVKEEYRMACIYISSQFFSLSEADQKDALVHEITHVILSPLTQWVQEQVIQNFRDSNPELFSLIENEIIRRVEMITEDLVEVINKK